MQKGIGFAGLIAKFPIVIDVQIKIVINALFVKIHTTFMKVNAFQTVMLL